MEAPMIVSISSAAIALISAIISGFSFYINTADRRLKDNPFFIFDSTTFESQYPNEIFVNTILYNFIIASSDKERLETVKSESVNEYKKKVNITKEKTYLKLYNAGGIGKNLTVETSIDLPIHKLETRKTYKTDYWDVIFEGENDNEFGEYSLFTNHHKDTSMDRIYFDSEFITRSPYKGITSDGYLNISIPKEFILFSNLFIENIIDESPELLINIKGKNVYDKEFTDTIKLVIERYKVTTGADKRYLSLGLRGL